MAPTVKCPTCEKLVLWSKSEEFRPFCCERCRLIDLGEWATASYAIPVKSTDEFSSASEPERDEWA